MTGAHCFVPLDMAGVSASEGQMRLKVWVRMTWKLGSNRWMVFNVFTRALPSGNYIFNIYSIRGNHRMIGKIHYI